MSVGLDLIEQPVTIKKYKIYDIRSLPKIILGLRIKNKFDEKRLTIKRKYKPELISHFKTDSQLEPVYLHGIEIIPKAKYTSLLQILTKHIICDSTIHREVNIKTYNDILSEFGLTCDTNYNYLSDGIYPIDIQHLDNISENDMSEEIKSGFRKMVNKTDLPWFMNTLNFNLFILSRSSGYNNEYSLNR
jgi:hypothetical protein